MYIKQITLEGFKSYRDRTVVGTFDRNFNAITGLNGSGKSNILDAICFVLGVNALATVRATCLGDLIYKGAGVSRATVSITFDNSDKSKSPPGFEDFQEIIVSRVVDHGQVCKYYLNSLNSTKVAVSDMFQHVGININHPNFIIMQGKITKVVNMKPMEVLQMIEETCGATAYQKKRDRIERDILERERKMEGMSKMIHDVILPALDQQTKAQGAVQEYHLTQRELHEKEKSLAIVAYLHYTRLLDQAKKDLDNLKTSEDTEMKDIEQAKDEIEKLKKKQDEMNRKAQSDNKLETITKEYDELKKPHHQKEAQVNSATINHKEAVDKLKKAESDYKKEEKEIENYRAKSKALIDEFDSIKSDIKTAEENIAKAKDTEEKIGFGNLVTDSGDIVNVGDQLNQVIASLTETKSTFEFHKKEFATVKTSVTAKENELKSCPEEADIERSFKQAEEKVKRLDQQLRQNKIDPTELPNLEKLIHESRQIRTRLENEQASLRQRYPYLHFTYDTPSPSFNPKTILGYVYEHFQIKDMDRFGNAIEVAVGGNLSYMIVDVPETAKLLLHKGNLPRRMTFLPMSAAKVYPPPQNFQATLDRKFGPGMAFVALDLIEYNPQVRQVIQSVFGSTVITVDQATAKAVAFEMGHRAVTLEGDLSEPGGTMQGGTRANLGSFIGSCQRLRQCNLSIAEQTQKLSAWETQREVCKKNQQLVNEHSEASRALKQFADIRALTPRATLTKELSELKVLYEEKEALLKAAEAKLAELSGQEKHLKTQQKNQDALRDKNLKDIQNELKKWEKALKTAQTKFESKNNVFQDIELEMKSKADFLSGLQKDIDEAKVEVEDCEKMLKLKQSEFQSLNVQFQVKHQELVDAKSLNKELEAENKAITKRIDELGNKIHELEIAHMKRETLLKDQKNRVSSAEACLSKVYEENRGMEFAPDMDPQTNKSLEVLSAEMKALKKKHEDMRQRLDFEKAAALQATKGRVAENQKLYKKTRQTKRRIEQTIVSLDNEKLKLVQKGYAQINAEFDTMMGILLPDSHAKLVPVNERNLMEGMNIHVCLGGVWKESLTELSGGQRSLVALSLVLSLCMYNPAPFYVLDEIDAALDLNHTQNIGYLLRHKFRTTQFVCVSLKDGMYSNANVLFQTTLLNGTSMVKRETPGLAHPHRAKK